MRIQHAVGETMNIEQWQAHIDANVDALGEWIVLCDGDGIPVCDFPPAESVSVPRTRLGIVDQEVVIPARGRIAPTNGVVDRLVADGLGVFDEQGYLVPATGGDFMVVVARPGLRLAFMVVFARAEGPADAPATLTIGGVPLADMLDCHPCPSIPSTWDGEFTEWKEDAGGPYRSPRLLAPVEMATRADGYTMTGPAVTVIRDLCQDSFDAVNELNGWTDDPHLVVDYGPTAGEGPRLVLQIQDEPLWQTIVGAAENAGVNVWVELWWPGDAPFHVRGARLNPDKEAGEQFGPPVLKTFNHPVGRVCVEEVGK